MAQTRLAVVNVSIGRVHSFPITGRALASSPTYLIEIFRENIFYLLFKLEVSVYIYLG